jgi:AraC family transcriptional regulator of adaptative response/methylated-DNA-[protein]-cysteine methyltransferase
MTKPPEPIFYCLRSSRLGRLLVAGTDRGVCFVRFGSREADLRTLLAREFAFAEIARARRGVPLEWADRIVAYVEGRSEALEVPLDVRGSRFQQRVWSAIGRIPRGQTRAYSDVAAAIGRPAAVRAVARACATNPTLVVTPCHRVIEKGGGLGGYAAGARRKRALLDREGARSASDECPWPGELRLAADRDALVGARPRRRCKARIVVECVLRNA